MPLAIGQQHFFLKNNLLTMTLLFIFLFSLPFPVLSENLCHSFGADPATELYQDVPFSYCVADLKSTKPINCDSTQNLSRCVPPLLFQGNYKYSIIFKKIIFVYYCSAIFYLLLFLIKLFSFIIQSFLKNNNRI